jgi:hypothetical protein
MADDFIARLLRANGQLIECLTWSIANKQLDCAANLQPVAQAFAAILADMVDRQEQNLTYRGKMKLIKKRRK